MKTEMIPVIWPHDLRIAGAVERKFAHQFAIPHLTVLIIPVRAVDFKLAVYTRSPKQSFSGSIDIFGGHCAEDLLACLTPMSCSQPSEAIIRATLIREANEELRMVNADGTNLVFDETNAKHLFRQVGQVGQFTVDTPHNVERSTLFLAKVSEGANINPCDEVDGEVFPVQVEWLSLDELLAEYQTQHRPFADGAARILHLAAEDSEFRQTLERDIESLCRTNSPATLAVPKQMGEKPKREGTMVLLTCHCVFDVPTNSCYAEHPTDRPIYEAHLVYALQHCSWRAKANPSLVVSGASTKLERHCSESRSYIEMATAMNLKLPNNLILEEYALTSIENVLLGLYAYKTARGVYPESIEVISWEFKRERFQKTLEAINKWQAFGETWVQLDFFPVGDLSGAAKAKALKVERDYIASLSQGLEGYYANPQTQETIQRRDVHNSRPTAKDIYHTYPLPF